ncbi:MAG: hypothetical protein AAGA32_22640, partial [Pseudomonadota bacterium]
MSDTVSPADRRRLGAIVADRRRLGAIVADRRRLGAIVTGGRRLGAIVAGCKSARKPVRRARIGPLTGDGLGRAAILREAGGSKTCVRGSQDRVVTE